MFLLFLILAVPSPAVQSYETQIMKERQIRDQRFADPVRSPLATSAILLLDKKRAVFGSSASADLRWPAAGVADQHLEVLRQGDQVRIRRLNGDVATYPEGYPVRQSLWKVDQYFQAGPVILVLQIHPVGPVLRVIDPESAERKHFKGLKYFPVDEKFRVRARIRKNSQPEKVVITDTQGWQRPAWIYGQAEFSIAESQESLDLILFEERPSQDSHFMVIFKDRTSGRETYPACRYLLIPFSSGDQIWLDFNRAFNPSCAYGNGFACPLPRPGNRLSLPITAGEKTYPRAH